MPTVDCTNPQGPTNPFRKAILKRARPDVNGQTLRPSTRTPAPAPAPTPTLTRSCVPTAKTKGGRDEKLSADGDMSPPVTTFPGVSSARATAR